MKKLLTLVMLAAVLQAPAQKISNRLNFPQGAKLDVVTKANSVVTIDMMGQTMDTKVNATITRSFDIEKVSGGTATIEHKMKRLQMDYESPMAGAQKFDSENEADMKGEGGKLAEKALKNKYTIVVDPTGKVTSVQADDNNPNKEGEASSDMMSGMLSSMAEGFTLPKAGDASEFHILPDREVAKGETWTDSVGGVKRTYTLAEVNDKEVVVTFTGVGRTNRKQEANGMEISMVSTDNYSGRMVLDRKTGLMKERSENIDSEGTMEMMGQSVPTKTKVLRTTTVNGI